METNQITMENKNTQVALISDDQLLKHINNLGLAKDLTEGEKNTYLEIAKAFNLNPFKREIHVSKYNGQMSIITGYEVYIKRAERTGLLDGWDVITNGKTEDGSLKAIITIYRKDRKYPFKHEVYYSEYVQKTKEGTVTKFWQKAHTMIKKVAMSQGFRLCFSDELGGMPYTKEELPDNGNQIEEATNVTVTNNSNSGNVETVTPVMVETKKNEINLHEIELILAQSTTLEELEKSYRKLSKEEQNLPEVITIAKLLKSKLTPVK